MATIQINHLCFFTLLFLFAFPVTKAFTKEQVINLCKETTSEAYCIDILMGNADIGAARDLGDVLEIVLSDSDYQIEEATDYLSSIRGQYTDPVGIRRMNECAKDYEIAKVNFEKALEALWNKTYQETKRSATIAENAVINCENVWRIGGPLQKSPFTVFNTNVSKLYGIICVILRRLGSR